MYDKGHVVLHPRHFSLLLSSSPWTWTSWTWTLPWTLESITYNLSEQTWPQGDYCNLQGPLSCSRKRVTAKPSLPCRAATRALVYGTFLLTGMKRSSLQVRFAFDLRVCLPYSTSGALDNAKTPRRQTRALFY
jgi:hypothetical protein